MACGVGVPVRLPDATFESLLGYQNWDSRVMPLCPDPGAGGFHRRGLFWDAGREKSRVGEVAILSFARQPCSGAAAVARIMAEVKDGKTAWTFSRDADVWKEGVLCSAVQRSAGEPGKAEATTR